MPKITIEIDGCTECSKFMFTINKGCFCCHEEMGFDKMIEMGILEEYNRDFHQGKLFKEIPAWCPAMA